MDVLVLFMLWSSARTAPEPDDPADRAEAPACAAEARRARQLAMLQELAEIGMQVARAVRDEALAPVEPAEMDAPKPASRFGGGDLGLVYSRVARAVRLTLALETRVAEEIEQARDEQERTRLEAIRKAAERRRPEIRGYVADAIEADVLEGGGSDYEIEQLLEDLDERLDEGAYDAALTEAPVAELVARICADFGVTPDWSLWEDQDWAIAHVKAQAAGDNGAEGWRDLAPSPGPTSPDVRGPPPDSG